MADIWVALSVALLTCLLSRCCDTSSRRGRLWDMELTAFPLREQIPPRSFLLCCCCLSTDTTQQGLCWKYERRPALIMYWKARSQRTPEASSPKVHKKMNPAKNHVSKHGRRSFSTGALGWGSSHGQVYDCSLEKDTEPEDPAEPHGDPWPTHARRQYVLLF